MKVIPPELWPHLREVSPLSLPHFADQFSLVEERLTLLATNQEAFRHILEKGAGFMGMANAENKINLVENGFFSEELLQAMICAGDSYRMEPVPYIWQRLVEGGLVKRAFGHMPGAFCDHTLNIGLLLRYLSARTLQNLFYPRSNLILRYSNAIVAIDVETADGDVQRGTGFIALNGSNQAVLVTCKHNVDPAKGIQVKACSTLTGATLEMNGPANLNNSLDLAYFPLKSEPEEPLFRFGDDPAIFDEVYTIGFPLVPHANPTVVGHRGEVNGRTSLYADDTPVLLVSNLVSPGSSGCPVLDSAGFCVGMTIKWLEAEYGDERARFSAALPGAAISGFLSA